MRKLLLVSLVAACGGSKPAPATGTPPAEPLPADPAAAAAPAGQPAPQPVRPAGHPRNDLIPRAVFFGNPDRVLVKLSPDGKHMSWLAPKDGVLNIWVAPIGKLDQAKVVTGDTVRPIRQYSWAYTSKHLLYMQDTGGDEDFHILRVDLGDGKTTDLTPGKGARAEIAKLSPRQPTTMLITINDRDPKAFDVHRVDLVTGKRTMVVQNDDGFGDYAFDKDLNVRLAYKPLPDGSQQLLVPETRAGKQGWVVFDTIPFEDSETSSVVGFTPDNKGMYFNESRGRDTAALVTIDLATKKQTLLAEDARADVGDAIVHPTKHHIQATVFEYTRRAWKVLDRSIEKDLASIAKLDDGEVKIVSRTLDDKWWIVTTDSEQRPGRFYLWDRARQAGTFLFSSRPELETQPLVKMTPLELKSRDGLTLVSYLSLSRSADPDGDGKANAAAPMVLLVHGGPWGRDRWGFNSIHQLLANRGYAVLSVNFRGSTGFGKKFVNAANLQWGKAMHDDLIDAVAWAVKTGITGKDTVCIMGGSYGGYATLAGVAMTPDVFRCGVDIVGPSNLLTLLASIPPYWAPLRAMFNARVGNPETPEGKALLIAASPLTHVASIKRPLLIGQGANDPRVKQAESEQIVAAMTRAGLPVSYVLFPDEGHGFARPPNSMAFFGVTEAFLSAHLGGDYLPLTRSELEASSIQIKAGRDGIPGLP